MKHGFSINLEGRVRNFPLPKKRPLVPLYEAVVNSIHAIEERRHFDSSFQNGVINIEVIRSPQLCIEDVEFPPVESFKITDNGIGFDEKNMSSFLESDSTYKAEIGGKGVGRFSWLKAFESVFVSSVFIDERKKYLKREFSFTLSNSYIEDKLSEIDDVDDCSTTIYLHRYLPNYNSDVPQQLETIAMRVIEHCLIYFLDNNCPRIILKDKLNGICLNLLFEERFTSEDNVSAVSVNGLAFELLNIKIEERSFRGNRLHLCANNRLVESKDLEKLIVDLDDQLFVRYGFWYVGILTGEYFDKNVDMNRLSFDIAENGKNLLDGVSMEEILESSCECITAYLQEYLLPIAEEKAERIQTYMITVAPQFRHLPKYMPDKIKAIKPNLSDDKLDDALYEIKRAFDKETKLDQGKFFEYLDETSMSVEECEDYYQKRFARISDANSSILAEYILHRRVIIDLFERGLRRQDDGKFNKERYMHTLVYPMKATSDDIAHDAHNLWLIDERLSYCKYISSDIPFDNDIKQQRSDILILDNPVAVSDDRNDGTSFDSIIIFELKRPMRDNYSAYDNPITQLYGYVRKIRDGEAKDKYHRPIRTDSSTKFFLYAVCDITDNLISYIREYDLRNTPDSLGYFGYNIGFNAYLEILSFDKVLNNAKKRNQILFEKLGI